MSSVLHLCLFSGFSVNILIFWYLLSTLSCFIFISRNFEQGLLYNTKFIPWVREDVASSDAGQSVAPCCQSTSVWGTNRAQTSVWVQTASRSAVLCLVQIRDSTATWYRYHTETTGCKQRCVSCQLISFRPTMQKYCTQTSKQWL